VVKRSGAICTGDPPDRSDWVQEKKNPRGERTELITLALQVIDDDDEELCWIGDVRKDPEIWYDHGQNILGAGMLCGGAWV